MSSSAAARDPSHISSVGRKLVQNAGRSGRPKIAQRKSGKSCTQGIPAGLPLGMPGIGDVIEGAMQHAPQPERQFMLSRAKNATAERRQSEGHFHRPDKTPAVARGKRAAGKTARNALRTMAPDFSKTPKHALQTGFSCSACIRPDHP
jgi:hypothetical protein